MISFSLHGVAVSSGIAIGQAHLVSNALLEVVHYQLPLALVEDEVKRFSNAVAIVQHDLEGPDRVGRCAQQSYQRRT